MIAIKLLLLVALGLFSISTGSSACAAVSLILSVIQAKAAGL